VGAYFLDSSAVAKLYMQEQGSVWVTSLLDPGARNELFVVRITAAEVAAAIFRRVRNAQLGRGAAVNGVAALRRDFSQVYRVIEVQPIVVEAALDIAERHGLRGYDCVQLAGVVLVQRVRARAGMSPLTLVSADDELNAAATAEDIAVEDPNLHA
jgi:predicted nucleic acid-binding protein